jgi:hypothetical protein
VTYAPRPGDIGLTTISGWGGKGIKAGQWLLGEGWGNVQHAFTVEHVDEFDAVWIVEAMPGGAQHVPNWHPVKTTHYLVCPDEHREAVAAAALTLVGVPYSAADYFNLAAHRFHIPSPHLRAYIESSKHEICSQLADHAALLGGWHLFNDGRWAGDVTPMDLESLYRKQRIKT